LNGALSRYKTNYILSINHEVLSKRTQLEKSFTFSNKKYFLL